MGKIFYIIGKSSTGKDTIYKRLLTDVKLELKPIVIYTTRPIREGEYQGVEYFFTNEEELHQIQQEGRLIELRSYHTIHGIWNYFTAHSEQINLEHENYLMLGVLESFHAVREYYGNDSVIPIYIEVEDGERLQRAIERERRQERPKYQELCRRFCLIVKIFQRKKSRQKRLAGVFRMMTWNAV